MDQSTERSVRSVFARGWPRLWTSLALALVGFAFGCSQEDKPRYGCCQLQVMCENCFCSDELRATADEGDEDGCDYELQDSDVADGCPAFPGTKALRECKAASC